MLHYLDVILDFEIKNVEILPESETTISNLSDVKDSGFQFSSVIVSPPILIKNAKIQPDGKIIDGNSKKLPSVS